MRNEVWTAAIWRVASPRARVKLILAFHLALARELALAGVEGVEW